MVQYHSKVMMEGSGWYAGLNHKKYSRESENKKVYSITLHILHCSICSKVHIHHCFLDTGVFKHNKKRGLLFRNPLGFVM